MFGGCFLRCFSGWTTDSSVRYGGLYPSRIFTVVGIYWFSLQAIPVAFWDRISMPSPSIHNCDRSFLSGLTGPLAGECHIFPWRLHPRKESPVKETVKKRDENKWKTSIQLKGLFLSGFAGPLNGDFYTFPLWLYREKCFQGKNNGKGRNPW